MSTTVTLDNEYCISLPPQAREALSLAPGDELLLRCEGDRIVIVPKSGSVEIGVGGAPANAPRGAGAYLRAGHDSR